MEKLSVLNAMEQAKLKIKDAKKQEQKKRRAIMITIYECENCDYTTENPPQDCVCPCCGFKLELIKTNIHLPSQLGDEELTF